MEHIDLPEFKPLGVKLSTVTPNQLSIINAIRNKRNRYIFVHGPAGTGKTHIAMAEALRTLISEEKEDKWCRRLRLIRPAVGTGRGIGFLPGPAEDKIAHFMRPFMVIGMKLTNPKIFTKLCKDFVSCEIPFYMRGDTFEHEIVIIDESQNITKGEMKLILSRLGRDSSKIIVVGDDAQPDIREESGFSHAMRVLCRYKNSGVDILRTTLDDMKRDSMVAKMLLVWDGMGEAESAERLSNVLAPLTYESVKYPVEQPEQSSYNENDLEDDFWIDEDDDD